ncbi:MAG TPA: alpha/beta hydrolase [Nitrospirota bacterium]|nr:alpha/beta hydrolase [Nitrospirota bacterium]
MRTKGGFSASFIGVGMGTLFLLFSLLPTGCSSLYFYPQKQLHDNPVAKRFSPTDIYFKSSDGVPLHGWFFQATQEAEATILVFHGNAENLSTHVNSVLWLVQEGFNVFIFDYRGYGRSEGSPDLKGVHRDGQAALETALNLARTKSGRVVVLGQSIGGAIAVYTVVNSPSKERIAALIIDSAFSSYRRIACEKLARFYLSWFSFLFSDEYSPVDWIAQVSPVPVLIMHGEADTIVPFHHAETLFAAAKPPKELWLVPAEGHVRSFANDVVRTQVVEYIDRVLGIP